MMGKQDREFNKKLFARKPLGTRKRGRPRLCRRNDVDEDARIFGIWKRWMVGRHHDELNGFLEEVKS